MLYRKDFLVYIQQIFNELYSTFVLPLFLPTFLPEASTACSVTIRLPHTPLPTWEMAWVILLHSVILNVIFGHLPQAYHVFSVAVFIPYFWNHRPHCFSPLLPCTICLITHNRQVCLDWIQVMENSDSRANLIISIAILIYSRNSKRENCVSNQSFCLDRMTLAVSVFYNCKPIKLNDYFREFHKIGMKAVIVWFEKEKESTNDRGSKAAGEGDRQSSSVRQKNMQRETAHCSLHFHLKRKAS